MARLERAVSLADQPQAHPDSHRPGLGRHHVGRRLDPPGGMAQCPLSPGARPLCHNVTPLAGRPPRPTVQGLDKLRLFPGKVPCSRYLFLQVGPQV